MFEGAYTAIITPFVNDTIDQSRLKENIEFQVSEGIAGLVPCGTTGESPTLTHEEHRQVIELVVESVAGRVPVIAGTGSNSTAEAIALTQHAAQIGVTASLQVVPYYNKPTQEGMYRHFMTIADACSIPLMLYNIPGRCGIGLTAETIRRLAGHEMIVAVKEATGQLDMASELSGTTELDILSGDDSLTVPMMSIGGVGVVSVLSNILPAKVQGMVQAMLDGKLAEARAAHRELFSVAKSLLTMATNPIPIKAAMQLKGMDSGELRMPMLALDQEQVTRLAGILRAHGLLD